MANHKFGIPRSHSEIEQISLAWRYAFDVDHQPAPDLLRLAEQRLPSILPTFEFSVQENIFEDGEYFDAYAQFDPLTIVLSEETYSRLSRWDGRGRFTLAHEFGHLFLHHGTRMPRRTIPTKQTMTRYMDVEIQANTFAACFLMPAHLVRDFRDPCEVAEFFKVSVAAAGNRLRELGLLRRHRDLPDFVKELMPRGFVSKYGIDYSKDKK